MKQLDQLHETILEEIDSFEKDALALKNMEEEFSTFWKHQTQTLNEYHQNEKKRIHKLRSSFEKNAFGSVEYEERIFNSERRMLKESIKKIQEGILKKMQEEMLLDVRRGLQTLCNDWDKEMLAKKT
ncbi:hypothetical protein GDO86_014574 [Hymenochirus boettgeri]|uniref:Uncharacterized protein n=1 Tax=Hymenochirus boettgeri TaxID=247094 RepID=A0A8T2JS85_9PIPI|nr:hypothetical protein GDO86_014574 [Hymenochirus boettgeri]